VARRVFFLFLCGTTYDSRGGVQALERTHDCHERRNGSTKLSHREKLLFYAGGSTGLED
jgi:hypothetical protein